MIDYYVWRENKILQGFNGYDSVPTETTREKAVKLAQSLANGDPSAVYSVESKIRELPYTPGITEWSSDKEHPK